MPYSPADVFKEFKLYPALHQWIIQSFPREELVWMLRLMCLPRFFKENAEDSYTNGQVHSNMHLSTSMEALLIENIATLEPDDLIIHNHRGYGHPIAKGADHRIMDRSKATRFLMNLKKTVESPWHLFQTE